MVIFSKRIYLKITPTKILYHKPEVILLKTSVNVTCMRSCTLLTVTFINQGNTCYFVESCDTSR